MLLLLLLVLLSLLGVLVGNLVDAVLETDDLGSIFEHVLLHLV